MALSRRLGIVCMTMLVEKRRRIQGGVLILLRRIMRMMKRVASRRPAWSNHIHYYISSIFEKK